MVDKASLTSLVSVGSPKLRHQASSIGVAAADAGSFMKVGASGTDGDGARSCGAEQAERSVTANAATVERLDRMRTARLRCNGGVMCFLHLVDLLVQQV
ncbi:hypothetical protein GCM10009107_32020 [Ideonella azotifigens]|uniref:ESPR domain-containing protein n=1 Tax=Ideonella azotifigens TaxID=513160 RepID=A0ABN1K514_9BURK